VSDNINSSGAAANPDAEPISILKPSGFSLDAFKVTRSPTIASVEVLLTALPIMKVSDIQDWVRLHPDEDTHWTPELCFVNVPIKGKANKFQLHLIAEDLALKYLPGGRIKRFRLALATKPYDAFFLAIIPTQNLDNSWNATYLQGCEQAKEKWTEIVSRSDENVDAYKIEFSHHQDAFPAPQWPSESILTLIEKTLVGRMIQSEDHPGFLRLIGARQALS
jgi:hypothetical protein